MDEEVRVDVEMLLVRVPVVDKEVIGSEQVLFTDSEEVKNSVRLLLLCPSLDSILGLLEVVVAFTSPLMAVLELGIDEDPVLSVPTELFSDPAGLVIVELLSVSVGKALSVVVEFPSSTGVAVRLLNVVVKVAMEEFPATFPKAEEVTEAIRSPSSLLSGVETVTLVAFPLSPCPAADVKTTKLPLHPDASDDSAGSMIEVPFEFPIVPLVGILSVMVEFPSSEPAVRAMIVVTTVVMEGLLAVSGKSAEIVGMMPVLVLVLLSLSGEAVVRTLGVIVVFPPFSSSDVEIERAEAPVTRDRVEDRDDSKKVALLPITTKARAVVLAMAVARPPSPCETLLAFDASSAAISSTILFSKHPRLTIFKLSSLSSSTSSILNLSSHRISQTCSREMLSLAEMKSRYELTSLSSEIISGDTLIEE